MVFEGQLLGLFLQVSQSGQDIPVPHLLAGDTASYQIWYILQVVSCSQDEFSWFILTLDAYADIVYHVYDLIQPTPMLDILGLFCTCAFGPMLYQIFYLKTRFFKFYL